MRCSARGVTPAIADVNVAEARPGAPSTPAEAILLGVLFDADAPNNLRGILRRVHELTLGVRSRLSRDAWHVLRRLSNSIESLPSATPEKLGNAVDVLDQILITLAAVSGTTLDNMVRSHAWAFLDMGRRVERGALSLVQLQALLPAGASRVHMEALLEVADSLLTYRARYLSTLQVAPVVDLLLTDTSNPRSVAFQVEALMDHFKRLQVHSDVTRSRAERRLISLQSTLLTADIEQACAGDGSGLRQLPRGVGHPGVAVLGRGRAHVLLTLGLLTRGSRRRCGSTRIWRPNEDVQRQPLDALRVRKPRGAPPTTSRTWPLDRCSFSASLATRWTCRRSPRACTKSMITSEIARTSSRSCANTRRSSSPLRRTSAYASATCQRGSRHASPGKRQRSAWRPDRGLVEVSEYRFDSPLVRAHSLLAAYARAVVRAQASAGRCRAGLQPADLRRIYVRSPGDRPQHAACAGAA